MDGHERASVLIVDDNDSSATWDLRFAEDHAQHGTGDQPQLWRYGDVCRSAQAARAVLLRAIKEGLLPDLVVIDQMLTTGGPRPGREPAGLDGVMRWLRDECPRRGVKLPRCVLWSSSYSPGLAYAFVQSGGTDALGRDVPAEEVMRRLWEVHRGQARWELDWTRPKLELTDSQLSVMPYFEANLATHEIAERMFRAGEIGGDRGRAENWVNQRRGDIMERVNALCDQLGLRRFEGRGLSVALARFALDHGNLWVPLAFREDVRRG